MHVNTGYQREALPLVRHHVEVFAAYDAVVAPSGSCVGSVRHQHADGRRAVGDEACAARRRRWRRRPTSSPSCSSTCWASTDVGAYYPTGSPTTRPATRCGCSGSATSRCSCCARCAGIDLVELPAADPCCGFGGTFALKNADTSTAMLADKMRSVLDTGAEVDRRRQLVPDAHRPAGFSRLGTDIGVPGT